MHRRLCELLRKEGAAELLEAVDEKHYIRYLHDLIRSTHTVTHAIAELEYEVCIEI